MKKILYMFFLGIVFFFFGQGVLASSLPFLDVDSVFPDQKKEKLILSLLSFDQIEDLQHSKELSIRLIGTQRKERKLGFLIQTHFQTGYKTYFDSYLVYQDKFIGFSNLELERQKNYLLYTPFDQLPDQYLEAFAYWFGARVQYAGGQLFLNENIPHTRQKYSLSCEANTLTDFINYYYQQYDQKTLTERDIIDILPFESVSFFVKDNKNYRGNPRKGFLGRINGRTIKYPTTLSASWGRGVLAQPLVPILNKYLSSFGQVALSYNKLLDEQTLIESLIQGHPVMIRYIYGDELFDMNIVAPDGSLHTLYKNQHVGLIVGATLDDEMNIKKVKMYDGLHSSAQMMSWQELVSTMKYLDQYILMKPLRK